jgi:sugar (pentulose or hexulose) kinase
MRFLGMDVGTGGTRAVVVDEAGKLLGAASSAHAPFRSEHPGWAEQDPEDWWRAAQESIRQALAAVPEPREPIAALALTGQMHGAVMLDERGEVLRPSLIWCDTRTQPECDWLTEKIGRERLIELTCNPALPNFTLTKLLWVKTHQPEIFAKIRHVMCPKDYVRYRLTGEFAIDVQEASGTLLLDVTHRRWNARSRRRRRPGRGRRGHGNPPARLGFRHHRHFRRGLRGHRRAHQRPAGSPAHLLPRGARRMARDGRDPECRLEPELAEGDVFRRPRL